jgi:hypothetical protein
MFKSNATDRRITIFKSVLGQIKPLHLCSANESRVDQLLASRT